MTNVRSRHAITGKSLIALPVQLNFQLAFGQIIRKMSKLRTLKILLGKKNITEGEIEAIFSAMFLQSWLLDPGTLEIVMLSQ